MTLLALLPITVLAQSRVASTSVPGDAEPRVLVFLAKGCPCNVRCMPDLELLAQELGPSTPLVGVVVGGRSTQVESYRKGLGCSFKFLSDPRGSLASRLGAVCSLDVALIDGNGQLVRLWEGVGRRTIAELGWELARRFPSKAVLDPAGFADVTQTGCRLEIAGARKSAPERRLLSRDARSVP